MAVWLCRAGRQGEHEARFFEDKRVYYTFEEIDRSLASFASKKELQQYFVATRPALSEGAARVFASQGFAFCFEMQQGDWVVTPSKTVPGLLHFAKITGDYTYCEDGEEAYRHYRTVSWFAESNRNQFEQDIQYSLGALMTICKLKQGERIKSIVLKSSSEPSSQVGFYPPPCQNLENASIDEISDFIIHNYKGHGLARIIEAILKAKGFTVYRSQAGADHGVDLLASAGSLGFGNPKICVQVKSTNEAIERSVLDQLLGTMANVGADYGLLVSWGGFKSSIMRDVPVQFFRVRLWQRMDIVNELLACYDKLDDEMKQGIPLKRIWVLDKGDSEEE